MDLALMSNLEDYWLTIILLLVFGPIFLFLALYTRYKLNKKIEMVEEAIRIIEKNDPIWRKKHLLAFVKDTFLTVQKAWPGKDREILRSLLIEDLYYKREGLLDRMDRLGQRNVVKNVSVKEILLVDIKDFTDDKLDRFTARIKASAVNYTVNTKDEWEVPKWNDNIDPNPGMESKEFIEFWTFRRHGDSWILAKVEKEWREGDYTDTEPVLKDEKYMKKEELTKL